MNGARLSHEARQELRQQVSETLRAIVVGPPRTCRGCGADLDAYTHGCRTCQNRRRAHEGHVRDVKTHNASGYRNGCRCDTCRAEYRVAYAAYQRAPRRRNTTAGQPSLMVGTGLTGTGGEV